MSSHHFHLLQEVKACFFQALAKHAIILKIVFKQAKLNLARQEKFVHICTKCMSNDNTIKPVPEIERSFRTGEH